MASLPINGKLFCPAMNPLVSHLGFLESNNEHFWAAHPPSNVIVRSTASKKPQSGHF